MEEVHILVAADFVNPSTSMAHIDPVVHIRGSTPRYESFLHLAEQGLA